MLNFLFRKKKNLGVLGVTLWFFMDAFKLELIKKWTNMFLLVWMRLYFLKSFINSKQINLISNKLLQFELIIPYWYKYLQF